MNKDIQLTNALEYLSYVIKEGGLDEDAIIGKTRDEIVEMAGNLLDMSDWFCEQEKDHEN